jgi:hypothetical protein
VTLRRGFVAGLLVLICAAPCAAQITFVGEWAGRYHEDQPDRVPGEEPGDFSGLPINDAARMFGDAWDVARHSVLEHQCAPYTLPYMFFGPNQFRIWEEKQPDTQELVAIRMYLGTYQQQRTIWMDGRPHPPEYAPHTFMGYSTGEWNGDTLTIITTHIKAGYFPSRRHARQRSHDGGRALDPARQPAFAGDDRHRPGVPDGAVHPQPGIRDDGSRQHELALQLRIRDGAAEGQERGAVLPSRTEPVAWRVRSQARDAEGRRPRRRRDSATRLETRGGAPHGESQGQRRVQT